MRKLNVYSEDAFTFYKAMVSSKRNKASDPAYKQRMEVIEESIEQLYDIYNDSFAGNDLQSLQPHTFTDNQRSDLLKLYSYRNTNLQKLKIKLTTIEFNKVLNTCQCCTIGEVGSFDHIVPKEEFPEFSVNPKNLFPSCHKCNSYKNVAWRNGDARIFLNLFLDDLPKKQYLFVDVGLERDNVVKVKFYLKNVHGVNKKRFSLIESHYSNLYLLQRFEDSVDSVITSLVNGITASSGLMKKKTIVDQIIATSTANKDFFGANYWKSIVEIALAETPAFVDAHFKARR